MKYLIDKETRQINLEVWFDEKRHLWLEQGVTCWNPDIFCEEGEEEENGYMAEDVAEEEILIKLADGYSGDFYFINGQLLTDKSDEL